MPQYLELNYRLWLFCKAYINVGGSLGALGRDLGYRGHGRNGIIRDMWLGKIGIPDKKFDILCKLAGIQISEVKTHSILKEQSTIAKDWVPIINLYRRYKNPSPEIFSGNQKR